MITYIKDMLNTPWGVAELCAILIISVAAILYALEITVRIYNKRRGRPW